MSVCRKAKTMFGLKVKKKKKKVDTDLVLANKGALGKAQKINTPTHKLAILVFVYTVDNRVILPVVLQPLSNSRLMNAGLHNASSRER